MVVGSRRPTLNSSRIIFNKREVKKIYWFVSPETEFTLVNDMSSLYRGHYLIHKLKFIYIKHVDLQKRKIFVIGLHLGKFTLLVVSYFHFILFRPFNVPPLSPLGVVGVVGVCVAQ